ncbi:MAG: TIGR02147 family protein [Pseudobacteriovorax sp.]|nr:TIGR02147 family protein [Pseudobacteriovorax sp.]
MENKLDIFQYQDFRLYLADYYAKQKAESAGFSYRQFSKRCGFSSPNFLKLVIDGKRNLSAESISIFIRVIGLNAKEGMFFRSLVEFCQEKDDQRKADLLQVMAKLRPFADERSIDDDSVQYMSHWLYPVIREMAERPDFCDDPYWISRRLNGRTSVRDIRTVLDFLFKAKFIVKSEDGSFSCQDKIVISSDEVKNLALRQYYRTILDQGKDMLSDLALEEREFGSLILTMPVTRLADFKQRLKEFRRSIHKWALDAVVDEAEAPAQVVQFNFQMFPQTKGKSRDS